MADKAFADKGCRFISLTNYTAMINLAVEKGIVAKETEDVLMQWRKIPPTGIHKLPENEFSPLTCLKNC